MTCQGRFVAADVAENRDFVEKASRSFSARPSLSFMIRGSVVNKTTVTEPIGHVQDQINPMVEEREKDSKAVKPLASEADAEAKDTTNL